ncbi:MAG: GTPase Era [Solobacterium sp.]|nr:GTPase Era [Solobacterium sp.]
MKSGFVALAGRPNAGKSTLINGLVNEKIAIVSPKPQTTRSEIRGIVNTEDAQIVFTDTPGIHKARHRLESRMNKEAANVIQGVDLIYLVVDGTKPYGSGDEFVLNMVSQAGVPVFLIFNKIDLLPKEKVLNHLSSWQERFSFAEFFPISALKTESFEDLLNTTISYLPKGEAMYPREIVSDNPENFRLAEIIREKILYCTEEEVPHATAVVIERKEYVKDGCEIQAMILVERPGQKAIIIGKQGSMLKKIGIAARKDIEQLLGCHVRLSLFVRVEKEWRDIDSRITQYGYGHVDE